MENDNYALLWGVFFGGGGGGRGYEITLILAKLNLINLL